MDAFVLVRGGGDLASGVVLRLHRAGIRVLITELPQPLVVRRVVSFAQAVFDGKCRVEEVEGRLVQGQSEIENAWISGAVPVLVDPDTAVLATLQPLVLVDARMTKRPPEAGLQLASLVIGLGPGFTAGSDCHAVIETQRGHRLGSVIWEGIPLPDTGIPETVSGMAEERILRAPTDGQISLQVSIGSLVKKGDRLARIAGVELLAPFDGLVRGLLHAGLEVTAGQKIGDLDPRGESVDWRLVSDKALAIGGGVLEAVLARPIIREQLWPES